MAAPSSWSAGTSGSWSALTGRCTRDLWRVACLAAVTAINGARTRVYALRDKLPADPLSTVVCMVAQGELQASVADYAALDDCRPAARACVLPPHLPFFWAGHAQCMALVWMV